MVVELEVDEAGHADHWLEADELVDFDTDFVELDELLDELHTPHELLELDWAAEVVVVLAGTV